MGSISNKKKAIEVLNVYYGPNIPHLTARDILNQYPEYELYNPEKHDISGIEPKEEFTSVLAEKRRYGFYTLVRIE